MHPSDCAGLLSALTVPWWVAGGWALDLFAGAQTRPHGDLDIGILRRDIRTVLELFSPWEVYEAQNGVLTRLSIEGVPHGVNSLWCRPLGATMWTLELLLDESAADVWVFRRQPLIQRPLGSVIRHTSEGLPYLAPEIQLLYKARDLRERDQADFECIAPRLDADARLWLRDTLAQTSPGHVWIQALGDLPG